MSYPSGFSGIQVTQVLTPFVPSPGIIPVISMLQPLPVLYPSPLHLPSSIMISPVTPEDPAHHKQCKGMKYCISHRHFHIWSLKMKNSVIIYSPSSGSKPVWISLFCCTQRKIFGRMSVTKQILPPIYYHSRKNKYYGSQWGGGARSVWLLTFFQISSFVFSRIKKFIQVWNYLRLSI